MLKDPPHIVHGNFHTRKMQKLTTLKKAKNADLPIYYLLHYFMLLQYTICKYYLLFCYFADLSRFYNILSTMSKIEFEIECLL